MEWIILLLIKDTRGDKNEIVVVRVFADPQVAEVAQWELKVQKASSPKLGHNSLLSAKDQEAHKWPSPRQNTI